MSVTEKISKLLKNGCDDDVLLNYIHENNDELECELSGDENNDELECELSGDENNDELECELSGDENNDELECELSGDEYKEPKKHKRNFCIYCNLEMLIDYQESVLVCTKCGVFEYYPVYVLSYNHPMKPSRRNVCTKDMIILRPY